MPWRPVEPWASTAGKIHGPWTIAEKTNKTGIGQETDEERASVYTSGYKKKQTFSTGEAIGLRTLECCRISKIGKVSIFNFSILRSITMP